MPENDFVDEAEARRQYAAALAAEEARTVAAFRRLFANPDGEFFLEWLRMACRVKERRLALGFANMNPYDLAAREALRALCAEIEWMVRG